MVSEKLGPALVNAIESLEANGYSIGEPYYKKVPGGFDADHPRADLLRYNGMGTMESLPLPEDVFSDDLVYFCFERYKKMLPIFEWLVEFNNSF